MDVKSTQTLRPMCVVIIYHPPTTNVQQFLDEFVTYANEIAITQQDILIVGDFNLHCKLNFAPDVKLLNEILAKNNLQHVTESTHIRGHWVDLVMTRSPSSIVSSTMAYPSSISDHYSVVFLLSSANPVPARTMRHLSDIRGINHNRFEADLLEHLASGILIWMCSG